jgi:hypothetical protein
MEDQPITFIGQHKYRETQISMPQVSEQAKKFRALNYAATMIGV